MLGTIAAFLISKSDRRLRERDEIADAVGIPVLAAVPVAHPSDATGWAKLLAEYEPGPVHAWRLRKVLQHLGLNEINPADPDNVASLAVLSLSSDPGAVALGPQLAVVAASLGIRTALVIGPQQDPNTTATLRAACTVTSATSPIWSRNLQVSVRDHGHLRDQLDVALNIVVIVVDGQEPQIEPTTATAVTVLGVSAGAATAEDLARVAVSAAADGRQLAGHPRRGPRPHGQDDWAHGPAQPARITETPWAPGRQDEGGRAMSDEDGTVRIPRLTKAGTPVRPWADDVADVGESPDLSGDAAAGLISLSFLTSALRRRARFWCITAVVGLLLGLALVFHAAPAYQATTSVVVTSAPGDNPLDAILTDQALAESRSVAGLALKKLGLKDSVTHFLSTYNVTSLTDKVLQFTITAPSSDEAVRRVAGLASEFLTFRADQARLNQTQVTQALNTQVSQQKAQVASLASQIATLQSQTLTAAQQAKLRELRTAHTQATTTLNALQQAALGEYANMRIDTSAVVNQSRVLDRAAPVVHSALKRPVEYAGGALVACLVMGMAFVIIAALLSDRLRRRDDVAYALGAQVRLSVPVVRLRRWLPGRHGLAAARLPAVQRIVSYLHSALPAEAAGGALVVIPADRPEVAALSVAALAVSLAQQGKKVVVADLSPGAHAARLLQSKEPGIRTVTVGDAQLVLVVAGRGDVVPVGPLSPVPSLPAAADDALLSAYGSADVLLTLAAVDPSSGADHLPTWGPRAVVTVTAGESTTTRIHAVGEIIRLSGTALFSAVLIGADKTDESLGIASAPKEAGPGSDGLLSFGSR